MQVKVCIEVNYESGNGCHCAYYDGWPFPIYPQIGEELDVQWGIDDFEIEYGGGEGVEFIFSGHHYYHTKKVFQVGEGDTLWLYFEPKFKLPPDYSDYFEWYHKVFRKSISTVE